MSKADIKTQDQFALPPSVVSKVDVSRLVSELEQVDSDLTAAAVREKAGAAAQPEPVLSAQLADFLTINKLELGNSQQRSELVRNLRKLKDKAPVIHLAFAATADGESLQQLAQWFRRSIHPQVVIAVGLQPSLAGGVYVRTPNQVHDLSVRTQLALHRNLLVEKLEALSVNR